MYKPPKNYPRIGISSCLLGTKVRFDGGHKKDRFLTEVLGPFVKFVPVCPEYEAGMGIPRESVRLIGSPKKPKMVGVKTGRHWTEPMNSYSRTRVRELARQELSGFVLKKSSPSCGMERVKVYDHNMSPSSAGVGLFARELMNKMPLLPVEEEGRLNDPMLRENFIERIFAFQRWREFSSGRKSRKALSEFHASQKYLLLAHEETGMRKLGRLAAGQKGKPIAQVYAAYGKTFMETLRKRATRKRHANVLQHMLGFFSPSLSAQERGEMVEIIDRYRKGLHPLVVPITMIRHYVKKLDIPWLRSQVYLDPHPHELMLRNHV